MKAEKVIGIAACAFACVTSSAFANSTTNWFDVGVSAGAISFSSNVTTNDTTVAGVTVEDGKIKIDNEKDTALRLIASSAPETSDGIVIITATAELTPNLTNDLFTTDVGLAKAGFAVGYDDEGNTNYYGYASGGWQKLGGTPTSGDTTFEIKLDYRTGKQKVYFSVAGTTIGSGDISATGLVSVDAFGTGSISSLDADCEVAEVAVNGVKYGSVADALADGGTMADIRNVDGSGSISENANAASGLPVAVCKALGIDPAVETPEPVKVTPVANDGDVNNITFAMDSSQFVAEGLAVKFAVKKGNAQVGELCESNAIKIPLSSGTGVYTVEPADVGVAQQ